MTEAELETLLKQKSAEFTPHFQPGFITRDSTVFQFDFATDPPFYLEVVGEEFNFCAGAHGAPTMSIEITNHDTCWGLLDGRIDGMQAFMEGQYRADGNIVLSQLLLYLFKSNNPTIAYEIQY